MKHFTEYSDVYTICDSGSIYIRYYISCCCSVCKVCYKSVLLLFFFQNGALQLIDRRKHIFKLSQGEFIAPEKIENVYARNRYVMQNFVYGSTFKVHLSMSYRFSLDGCFQGGWSNFQRKMGKGGMGRMQSNWMKKDRDFTLLGTWRSERSVSALSFIVLP